MPTTPIMEAPLAASSSSPEREGSSRSSAESPVSLPALPTEAELRAADLELDAATRDELQDELQDELGQDDRQSRIRAAAYAAFLRRGDGPGDADQDWFEAEREVNARDANR